MSTNDLLKSDTRRKTRIAVLSFSRVAKDRRVLRQLKLLGEMGFMPHLISYAEPGDSFAFGSTGWPAPRPTTANRLRTVALKTPAHLGLHAAKAGFWADPCHRRAFETLKRWRPQIILANDWPALVVAARYKSAHGGRIHYDTHEFATLEFDERLFWRVVYKAMVYQLERDAIGAADSISTVGPKLAEALQKHYKLARLPSVIRNIPNQISLVCPPPAAWPLRILYHGQVLPDRGLEALIDSIPLWHTPHRVVIRGNGNPGYIARLRAQAEATGRCELLEFQAAVMPDEVMEIASKSSDLGVHFTPLDTDQRHFSLPNKLFEYIGAGLAVAVSPGADLREVVEQHKVGIVSRDAGHTAVADAINSLTREDVTRFKAASRTAGLTLCWENEQSVLYDVIERLVSDTTPQTSA